MSPTYSPVDKLTSKQVDEDIAFLYRALNTSQGTIFFVFGVRVLVHIAYAVGLAVGCAVETVALATSDIYGIGKAIFAQGVSEVPHRLGMTTLDIEQAVVAHAYQSTSLHLAVKVEF